MSRDVFDEMSSWYKPVNVIDDVDAQNGNAAQDSQQQSLVDLECPLAVVHILRHGQAN